MSKLYVFGIGGTGSRVLRSLTMMLAAGVKTSQSDVVPIVIDPDSANADLTRTVALMNKYANLRQHLTFPEKGQGTFFKAKIDQILPNYNLLIKDTEDRQFQQFIELPAMNKQNQAMMRMLFSEKNLASSMNVGFKGNPHIGSVVLNQIVNSEDFITFANSFEKGDKIFIVSSIFGGTGASGFPLLLKTLRTGDTFPNNDLINKAEIGAVTILPYFKLEQSEDSEIDSIFRRTTRSTRSISWLTICRTPMPTMKEEPSSAILPISSSSWPPLQPSTLPTSITKDLP